MNKVAKILGIVTLSSVAGMGIASGYGYHHSEGAERADRPACEFQQHKMHASGHYGENGGHFKGHHKMGFKADSKNMTSEKRVALMQLKVENRLERMTQKYDLSADQQAKIRQILQERQQKVAQLKQQSREQIDQVLTQEQLQKRQQRREQTRTQSVEPA